MLTFSLAIVAFSVSLLCLAKTAEVISRLIHLNRGEKNPRAATSPLLAGRQQHVEAPRIINRHPNERSR